MVNIKLLVVKAKGNMLDKLCSFSLSYFKDRESISFFNAMSSAYPFSLMSAIQFFHKEALQSASILHIFFIC